METALNALWDSGAGPGDRIAVVGGRAWSGSSSPISCAGLPGAEVCLIDRDPARAATAQALGLAFALPEAARAQRPTSFHASASAAGLALALSLAGDEATIVELSWYGTKPVAVPLGLAFHVRRLRLIASQVGTVAASRRPRWSPSAAPRQGPRSSRDPRLDALLTRRSPSTTCPRPCPPVEPRRAGALHRDPLLSRLSFLFLSQKPAPRLRQSARKEFHVTPSRSATT